MAGFTGAINFKSNGFTQEQKNKLLNNFQAFDQINENIENDNFILCTYSKKNCSLCFNKTLFKKKSTKYVLFLNLSKFLKLIPHFKRLNMFCFYIFQSFLNKFLTSSFEVQNNEAPSGTVEVWEKPY